MRSAAGPIPHFRFIRVVCHTFTQTRVTPRPTEEENLNSVRFASDGPGVESDSDGVNFARPAKE